ncbi:flavin-containing monooxygenase [Actibacterium sp. XHP0104]|uniref:flavin-containing monooxygenase n=1 Tax=Actibacterium sp. XHP0104 TaxID=2984335 RepID=UPI0021E6DD54|nr:NAD(P)-binding domain-containing protein [Actibacterium sp. XHP0104]MCV2881305.1 NAD(P)-binding domain-containing protein [Actibacterium sp. XHP0104]
MSGILDCIIIGAGQAGLISARLAEKYGLSCVILEKGAQAGAEWAARPPGLRLFTTRRISALRGLELSEGPQDGYPDCAEMARYFAGYARHFDLPVRTGADVTGLSRRGDLFEVALRDGEILRARTVILANGSNQMPHVPAELAAGLDARIAQSDARDYWRDMPPADARVLVVGDGASGRQVARELAERGCRVHLSGRNRRLAPEEILGRNLFFWLMRLGLLRADKSTLRARLVARLNPVPAKFSLADKVLRKAGVEIVPETVAMRSAAPACLQADFADDSHADFDQVIWAVGYRENSPFNSFAAGKDERWYTQGRGQTEVPGLYVVGRVWLSCRASELVLGAEADAKRVILAAQQHVRGARQGAERAPLPLTGETHA